MSLPTGIRMDQLSAANRRKLEWFYRRYVEQFYPEYQFGHFLFAAYAAVPALLTPDLLYKLWQNFHQYQWSGKTRRIHRVAVSDLLLSPLCREVGYELYEIEPSIRKVLLDWLQDTPDDPAWQKRQVCTIRAIADFLEEYHARPNPARQRWGSSYDELQEWNVLALTDPSALQTKMWEKLRQSVTDGKETETLRVLDFWSKAEAQLPMNIPDGDRDRWQQYAQFADAWKALVQHNTEAFTAAIAATPDYRAMLNDDPEGGVAVQMPAAVREELDKLQPQDTPNEERRSRVKVLAIGIDEYEDRELSRLAGRRNDVHDFQLFLDNITEYLDLQLDIVSLLGSDATIDTVRSSLHNLLDDLQDGDHFIFFFAGHSVNALADEEAEQYGVLILYDSKPGFGWSGIPQDEIEDLLMPVLQEKRVNAWLILDHPKGTPPLRKKRTLPYFRDSSLSLKGSLEILYGAEQGQKTYERTFGREMRGVFPFALLTVIREKGFNISFRNLVETTRLRMTQLIDQQTPVLEAFPEEMADALIFSHEVFREDKRFELRFDPELSQYVLSAGARQGITPSLEFMETLLQIEDSRTIAVDQVYRDYATLRGFTGDGTVEQKFEARLLQTALPKIQIAFDPNIDEKMEAQLRSVISSFNIYYIDIRDRVEEAQYFIHAWQNNYFLARQTSNRQTNSGAIRPLFNLEQDPFELIKQMEYIAQWSGVLEYHNPNARLEVGDLHVRVGLIEGRRLDRETLNEVETEVVLEDPSIVEVQCLADASGRNILQPALQLRLYSEIKRLIHVQLLYLDSNYGILGPLRGGVFEPGQESLVPFVDGENEYRTIPLNFDPKNLDLGKTEIYDYIKIFIADQPIDVEPLQQESLELDREVTRTIIARQQQERGTFRIGEVDWTTITIPIRIKYQQVEPEQKQEPVQQRQPPVKEGPFTGNIDYMREDFSGSESPEAESPSGSISRQGPVKNMIAEGDLNGALERLLKTSPDHEKEIVQQLARLNKLERDRVEGLITGQDYDIRRQQIAQRTLQIVDLTNDSIEGREPPAPEAAAPETRRVSTINPSQARELRNLIAEGALDRAFEKLRSELGQDTQEFNEALLLNSRFRELEKGGMEGIISEEDHSQSRNRITFAVLELIDRLEALPPS